MSRKLASLFAAAAIVASSIGPALAEQAVPQTRSVIVQYGDLDLSRAEGIKTITGRLDRALDKVCGSTRQYALALRITIIKCRTKALNDAVAGIDEPLLTALYTPSRVTMLASR